MQGYNVSKAQILSKAFFLEVKDSTKTKRNMYAEFYIHVQ